MQRVYLQCPLGHYSSGTDGCWFDYWLQRSLDPRYTADVSDGETAAKIAELAKNGFPEDLLPHTILLDFGASESAFDGMIPLGFFRPPAAVATGIDPWTPLFPDGFAVVDGSRPVLYFRCNGGHYFTCFDHCPLDGWSAEGLDAAQGSFSDAISRGLVPRPKDIVSSATSELRGRIIIAQFGDPRRAVQGILPMIYRQGGRTYLERESPAAFF